MGGKGKPFKKGVSGNPGGRKKESPIVSQFRKTSYEDFINYLNKYGAMNQAEMKAEIERVDCTMFEKIFGRIIYQAAQGEKDGRQVLLERLWGKVKDQVEFTQNSANQETEDLLRKIPLSELVALAKKYEAAEKLNADNINP